MISTPGRQLPAHCLWSPERQGQPPLTLTLGFHVTQASWQHQRFCSVSRLCCDALVILPQEMLRMTVGGREEQRGGLCCAAPSVLPAIRATSPDTPHSALASHAAVEIQAVDTLYGQGLKRSAEVVLSGDPSVLTFCPLALFKQMHHKSDF